MMGSKRRSLRAALVLASCLSAWPARADPTTANSDAPASSLEQQFQTPPESARPRVWWHWLDGNISKDGITKDLEWMKRVGIGGAQNFDGSFGIRTLVEKRVVYMSPEWKDAFHHAAELADSLGLELGVAGSPGWSESGGPWVKSQDAMKKLVWSGIDVSGGHHFKGVLPAPPSNYGPFQDMPMAPGIGVHVSNGPGYYGDVAVLAYRSSPQKALPLPSITAADGTPLDAAALSVGSLKSSVGVPAPTASSPSVIVLRFDRPTTVRSARIFIAGGYDMFSGTKFSPVLEASDDGSTWTKIANMVLSDVPSTIGFTEHTALYFRIVTTLVQPTRDNSAGMSVGFAGFRPAASSGGGSMHIRMLQLSAAPRVNQFEVKAGFSTAQDYPALDTDENDWTPGVTPAGVIDLTDKMKPDGILDWAPPKGDWHILRLGYSLTGTTNHPATPEATGLEVDKLDGAAVRTYLETYLGHFREFLGSDLIGAHGLRALVNDSTEVGPFNWTPKMLEKFRRLRGYDPRPWLPTLTGELVGTRAQSDAFLIDFRRTIADLHASEHYGTIAQVAHENGMRWYSESLEGGRPSLGDDMDMRRHADVPMGAQWTYPASLGPRAAYLFDMRGAASTAHIFGQQQVGAESMTSTRQPWASAPSDLRRIMDSAFANGINLPVIHTSIHQPTDQKPGLSMLHIGQFFNRNESWAEMAGPWVTYLARNAFMLQQGHFVADVAYFYGEDEPTPEGTDKTYFNDAPRKYAYDLINATAVKEAINIDHGDLVAPSGARYRVLFLSGTSDHMTLPMLRRIAELAQAGATIVGNAPAPSPSIDNDTAVFDALVHQLWSGHAITTVGAGRVIAGMDVEAALKMVGVKADVALSNDQATNDIRFVHRHLTDGDVYFLSNASKQPGQVETRFRVNGLAPELWRADTGAITPLSYRIDGDETVVPLTFEPEDSYFVVFRKPAKSSQVTAPTVTPRIISTLSGPWSVSFEPDRGAPPTTILTTLAPLSENTDNGIRYFSGIATYTKNFLAPAGYRPGTPVQLDLGRVGDLADVRLNGRLVGNAWHAPFRVNLGSALRPGKNRLEIRVADLWVNRLIGDAQPGAKKITFTVTPTYRADTPLRPSGLIGPVSLMSTGAN